MNQFDKKDEKHYKQPKKSGSSFSDVALKQITTKELMAEIDRRVVEDRKQAKPKIISKINIKEIKRLANEYVEFVDGSDYHEDNDWSQWMFEGLLTAVYGQDFWKWHNKRTG